MNGVIMVPGGRKPDLVDIRDGVLDVPAQGDTDALRVDAQEWHFDPVGLALSESVTRQHNPHADWPDHLCLEIGRRLLLAELEFSEWVLRRVEKVNFERDRSVTRAISVEFKVR